MTMTKYWKTITGQSQVKLFRRMVSRFLRLNISQKMHLGFLPLVILLVLVSTIALTKLNHLTSLNESVLAIDIPIQNIVKQMNRTVIDQESILRRFIILKDEAFLEVFSNNNMEFSKDLESLKRLSKNLKLPLDNLEEAYTGYASSLLTGIKILQQSPGDTPAFDKTIKTRQADLLDILSDINDIAKDDQNEKIGVSASIGTTAFKFALILCFIGIFLSAAGAALVTKNIVLAVKKLQLATEEISNGNFDYHPNISNKDELGDLAKSFFEMGGRLKNLEEMYLDASPLTRLPGGIAIENTLKKRIENNSLFAFCLLDIDNFKSFNDHYGYAQGNDMIQNTAATIEEVAKQYGSPDSFTGHIGGDDFVVITTPDKYELICREIINQFDAQAPTFYSAIDRKRGYIAGVNRQGKKVNFPLASISIAVVTNQDRVINNHIEVGEIVAEIKERAKDIIGSSLVTDQRQTTVSTKSDDRKLIDFPHKAK